MLNEFNHIENYGSVCLFVPLKVIILGFTFAFYAPLKAISSHDSFWITVLFKVIASTDSIIQNAPLKVMFICASFKLDDN